jgi:hypothetical protein
VEGAPGFQVGGRRFESCPSASVQLGTEGARAQVVEFDMTIDCDDRDDGQTRLEWTINEFKDA